MKTIPILILSLVLAAFSHGAMAGSMRCGSKLIDDGAKNPLSKDQVKSMCGEPTSRVGNQWVYKQQGKKSKVVYFDTEGNLLRISDEVVKESTGEALK